MRAFREEEIAKIRKQVGKSRVLCGLSGGVDSSVAAVLLHEAIGDQLTCVFVDHGLLRKGEAQQVEALFRGSYNIPFVHVNASEQFLKGAEGRHRSGAKAEDDRQTVHRCVRGRGEKNRQGGFSGRKARSIPT